MGKEFSLETLLERLLDIKRSRWEYDNVKVIKLCLKFLQLRIVGYTVSLEFCYRRDSL
jgi:hypothetical protein